MNYKYFNDTEKDLTYNWIACFGSEDANYYRKNIIGDNYNYNYWTTYWRPRTNIPYWIVDDNVGDVFTICFNDEVVDKAKTIKKTAQFMMEYADKISR